MPCEIAWHLRIIEFGEVIQCLEKSASWKGTTKVGDKLLVNLFADKHIFELIQLLKTTDLEDEDLFLNLQKMVSSEGLSSSASAAFFLQHALTLYKESPASSERQEMVKNFLSLHLSTTLTFTSGNQTMIEALYTELAQNVPTLFRGSLPKHAISVVATRVREDKYDIVIVNSGGGIKNHESTTEIQPKGFHTGTSYYDDVSTSKPVKVTFYNPLLQMKGITGAQLSSAHYHNGTMEEVYYVAKHASSHVVTEPLMPWEWTEAQGIGTCTATSVWFALRFYYQALAYENDLRLSTLDQAIDDLKELQGRVEDIERQLNADYQKELKTFRETSKGGKADRFDYDQSHVKGLALAKDKSGKSLHLRRTIISMALNEILRNLIVWYHELDDITANLTVEKSKDKEFTKTAQHSKMTQRREVLAKAILQIMTSFHNFWKLQEKKYAERQMAVSGEEARLSSVSDSWLSIRADVRTMYNDAIRVLKIKPAFKTVLEKEAVAAQRKFKLIDVKSLDEHSSLKQILGYIINFGDTPKLREAISEHTEKHTKNANAAKYLLVLYACLTKNVPLLKYLVVQQKLPLRYTIDRAKKDDNVSMYWDLETEESIAALAAHGFAKYGQPLNTFPQLFAMSKKETQGIVSKFKSAYKRIAPIVDVEKPLQDKVDKAFKALVEQGRIAGIACILPKASKEAVSDAFTKTDNIRILRLLIDLVKDPKLLERKIEASIKKNNAKIVKFLLPLYLRHEKQTIEKAMIKAQRSGSPTTGKPSEATLPGRLFEAALDRNAVKFMKLLAPFGNEYTIRHFLLAAAKDGKSEMAHALTRYATGNAIFSAIEAASMNNHGDLRKALFEEFARKRPTEAMFLKAAEECKLDDLEKLMPGVSADTMGYALLKAAEKGKVDCFEKLVPHSTEESIKAAFFKLSNENLKHPSVLKAINNASRLLDYGKIVSKAISASNVELIGRILPFMSTDDVTSSFGNACKDEKSFEITKYLFPFAETANVTDSCLDNAIENNVKDQVILLLPRMERERLVEISHLSEFEKFGDTTRQAAANRIENFATEVAIELAFLPQDKNDIRASLEAELEEYNAKLKKGKADLACKDQKSCIDMINSMGPSAFVFPIEQAIDRLLGRKEDSAALKKLLPLATPYACSSIVSAFSHHGSKGATKNCAGKALKAELVRAVCLAQKKKNFALMKSLVPFLSPLEIVKLLELCFSEKINAAHVKGILAGLSSDLAGDALRIAVRGDEKKREASVHYLLPKASQVAIDEVYLFAKRIKFDASYSKSRPPRRPKPKGRRFKEL